MTSEYMQVPDGIKLVKFETDKLQMGDIIAYYSPSMGEVLRYLIHEVDGCLVRALVLLDRSHDRATGQFMTFAKSEFDNSFWRKIA